MHAFVHRGCLVWSVQIDRLALSVCRCIMEALYESGSITGYPNVMQFEESILSGVIGSPFPKGVSSLPLGL